MPLQLVFKSTMTQRLPNCKIVSLTVTTAISAEVIKLICTRYTHCLRMLKLTHLNTTRETQLNDDSLAPLRNLTKLRQLALAWRSSPNLGPSAFGFLSYLKKLRKLSLEIYEKRGSSITYSTVLPVITAVPLMTTYSIPLQDLHEHSADCWRCPYASLHPLARLSATKAPAAVNGPFGPGNPSPHNSGQYINAPSPTHASVRPQTPAGDSSWYESFTSPITSPSGSPPNSNGHSLLKSSRGSGDGNLFSYTTTMGPAAPTTNTSTNNSSSSHSSLYGEGPLVRATSAGLPVGVGSGSGSANGLEAERRSPLFQSAPGGHPKPAGGHVKPMQTISTSGTNNPAPISMLKILSDLPQLEELKLSNWRDFGPLFLLAPLAKIATLTIKGRPSDLMTDGASVADAARHFLFLATLSALRNLTLAWIPPCLPQLVRLTILDLSQAPNLDDAIVADFSRGLTNLTSLSLDGLVSGGQLTNTSVAHLYNLPLLRVLDMSNHPLISHTAFSLPSGSSNAGTSALAALSALSASCNDLSLESLGQKNDSSGSLSGSSSDLARHMSHSSSSAPSTISSSPTQTNQSPMTPAPWLLTDLRLNNTHVASLAPFARFAATLQHLHIQGCEYLGEPDVVANLPKLSGLISFRFMNKAMALQGGLSERMLLSYSACPDLVCLCDRVISNTRNLSLLPLAGKSLQFLELYNNPSSTYTGPSSSSSSSGSHQYAASAAASLLPQAKIPTEHFYNLTQLTSLVSIRLTGELLTASLIRVLAQLPALTSLTASRVDENSSSAAKNIAKLLGLNYLAIHLTSSSAAAIWMKYVVTLPNLLHFDDGITFDNSNVPWATHRRLYLEWHPRAVKPNRTNNCTIS